MKSNQAQTWTCPHCISTELPFHGLENIVSESPINQSNLEQPHDHHTTTKYQNQTDNKTVIKLSKFISSCFEKRSKWLEAMNADSQ
jgi:hypothetical protein